MSEYVKYPKTLHLPWSECVNGDDKIQHDLSWLDGEDIVCLEKMDGENCSFYNNHYHARSIDSQKHWTREKMWELQKRIGKDIPSGWRICGENLYAEHSVSYNNLPDYFLVFSIWNDKNMCLSWKDTVEWCELLNLHHVPVLFEGKFAVQSLQSLMIDTVKMEGYVVRLAHQYHYDDFQKYVLKWVRRDHVNRGKTNGKHWMYSNVKINRNKLYFENKF